MSPQAAAHKGRACRDAGEPFMWAQASSALEASGANFCNLELTLLMQLCFQQYRSRLGGKTIQTSK